MESERKKIIQYSLDFEIDDIHTYSGYKGDLIVKITAREKSAVAAIRQYALSLGIHEVVIKQNPNLMAFEIYCITSDENVYRLKPDVKNDNRDHNDYVEDTWSKTALN